MGAPVKPHVYMLGIGWEVAADINTSYPEYTPSPESQELN
jgi:hypothetical protein